MFKQRGSHRPVSAKWWLQNICLLWSGTKLVCSIHHVMSPINICYSYNMTDVNGEVNILTVMSFHSLVSVIFH